jgi:hypothetical protein
MESPSSTIVECPSTAEKLYSESTSAGTKSANRAGDEPNEFDTSLHDMNYYLQYIGSQFDGPRN